MTRMGFFSRILLTAAAAVAATSCGDVVRAGRAPVFLVIDSVAGARGSDPEKFTSNLSSDVITNITSPAPCSSDNPCPTIFSDGGQVTFRLSPKDIGPAAVPSVPSANNEVTVTRVHVAYRRTDGRNTQGVDVPYAFDTAATVTVPASGTATMGFLLVRNTAKMEAPLVQLKSNGVIISTIADVTFYGQDMVGNAISATGSIGIDFGNFGD